MYSHSVQDGPPGAEDTSSSVEESSVASAGVRDDDKHAYATILGRYRDCQVKSGDLASPSEKSRCLSCQELDRFDCSTVCDCSDWHYQDLVETPKSGVCWKLFEPKWHAQYETIYADEKACKKHCNLCSAKCDCHLVDVPNDSGRTLKRMDCVNHFNDDDGICEHHCRQCEESCSCSEAVVGVNRVDGDEDTVMGDQDWTCQVKAVVGQLADSKWRIRLRRYCMECDRSPGMSRAHCNQYCNCIKSA